MMHWYKKTFVGTCPRVQGVFVNNLEAARRRRVNDTAMPRLCHATAASMRATAASVRVTAASVRGSPRHFYRTLFERCRSEFQIRFRGAYVYAVGHTQWATTHLCGLAGESSNIARHIVVEQDRDDPDCSDIDDINFTRQLNQLSSHQV
jgi:hypothetical protein